MLRFRVSRRSNRSFQEIVLLIMFRKKRLVLYVCSLLLLWLGWRVDLWAALACLGGGIFLLSLIKVFHIIRDHLWMTKLSAQAAYRFEAMEAALPEPAQPRPWKFVVLGDTRNNTQMAGILYEKAGSLNPVMVFHTGDIVRGGTASELLQKHVRVFEKHLGTVPLFCIPGNHERGPRRNYAAFKTLYGDDKFSFVYDDCLFIGFNNCHAKYVTDEDLHFLEEALATARKHKFVFTHIPPAFFEASFVKDERRRGFTKNEEAFQALLCKHGVDEVFYAHIHGYATLVRDGVRHTLTAGGGAPLSHRIVEENRHFHLIQMEVCPDTVTATLMLYEGGTWSERAIAE
jgi:hypothetical protein